jgi:ribosomal protein L44E
MDISLIALPLLICGTLVVLVAVASVSSYVLLRYADAVARKCPHCQKKGGGEVVEYELIDSRTYVDAAATQKLPRKFRDKAKPVKVEEKKYEVDYKCKHCGHEWTDFATDKEEVSSA